MRGEAMTPSCAPLQTEEVETGRGHLDLRGRKSNSKTEKKKRWKETQTVQPGREHLQKARDG